MRRCWGRGWASRGAVAHTCCLRLAQGDMLRRKLMRSATSCLRWASRVARYCKGCQGGAGGGVLGLGEEGGARFTFGVGG